MTLSSCLRPHVGIGVILLNPSGQVLIGQDYPQFSGIQE